MGDDNPSGFAFGKSTSLYTREAWGDEASQMRNITQAVGEWRSISHLLTKDMYILTPWHARDDRFGWTALAYMDEEAGEGLLLAFRMEDCAEDRCTVKMDFADPDKKYAFCDADTGEETAYSGEELADGVTLSLPAPRSCLMKCIRWEK